MDAVERIRTICRALPEIEVADDRWATSFKVRRRMFASVVTVDDPGGAEVVVLVVRADPEERDVLLRLGHPYFPTNSGRDRVGVVLEEGTDWDEIAELVTESYVLNAPKKLAALVAPQVDR